MQNKNAVTTIRQLLDFSKKTERGLGLNLLTNKHNLSRHMMNNDINRPGMNLFNFYEYFAFERLQVFGKGETSYLLKLDKEKRLGEISKFFEYEIPAIVFTHNQTPPLDFIKMAEEKKIPVISSELTTSIFSQRLQNFFSKALAPKVIVHGVMMDIFGMGILLEGESGAGKSECALELIERGHRFIADDVVDIRLLDGKSLIASSSQVIAHHMEIQGIGIINVAHLYGVGSIRDEISVDMIVHIEPVNKRKKYDRIGLETVFRDILDVPVPLINIPVQPGTNIPILIETAAMNQRLKLVGYNPAKEFNKKLISLIEQGIDIY